MEAFRGVLEGPRVLKQIREVALTCPPEHTKQAIEEVLKAENYTLSRKQRQLFQGVDYFAEYRQSLALARTINQDLPNRFRMDVAISARVDPDKIVEFIFNPLSVTISLEAQEFRRIWRENEDIPQADKPINYPGGFCDISDEFWIMGRKVPFNFMDDEKAPADAPQHEDLHNQYFYLHPTEITVPKERRGIRAFTRFCQAVTERRMQYFLNEVSARAGSGKGWITHELFWSDPLYWGPFKETVEKVQQQIPKDPVARLPYQAVLDEFLERLRYRTDTVRQMFSVLETDHPAVDLAVDREYNVAVAQFLTPENGFVAEAILNQRAPKLEEARRWRNAPKGPRGEYKISFFRDVVLHTAQHQETPYLNQEEYEDYCIDLHAAISIGTKQEVAEHIRALKQKLRESTEQRFPAVQRIFNSLQFAQLPVTDEQRQAIRRQVLLSAIDFHTYFGDILLNIYQSYESNKTKLSLKTVELYEHFGKTMVDEWFCLEDAAEELAATLYAGQKPNYRELFTPRFKKPDLRYSRLLECIESGGRIKIFDESPMETATLGMFKMRFITGLIPFQDGQEIEAETIARKAASLFVRLLNWAQKQKLSAAQTATTRDYLILLTKINLIPPFIINGIN